MPIEDPTIEWDEAKSAFIKVATIVIEQGKLEFPISEAEPRSFNPWHSLVEHKPLGGINRLRRRVYEANARMRRESAGIN
jgi:hypothetical protein